MARILQGSFFLVFSGINVVFPVFLAEVSSGGHGLRVLVQHSEFVSLLSLITAPIWSASGI